MVSLTIIRSLHSLEEKVKALNIAQMKQLRKVALESNNIEEIQRGLDDIES